MPFLSVFFLLHRNDFALLNLITKYMTSTTESFLKSKDNVDLCKINLRISELFIQCNTGSCCACVTMVLIYISIIVSIYDLCVPCVCQCVQQQTM